MKKIGIAIMLIGFVAIWCGTSGPDTGVEDKLWMAATILGVLFIIIGRLFYQYSIYLEQERARKSRRYRRYIEIQKRMSA